MKTGGDVAATRLVTALQRLWPFTRFLMTFFIKDYAGFCECKLERVANVLMNLSVNVKNVPNTSGQESDVTHTQCLIIVMIIDIIQS